MQEPAPGSPNAVTAPSHRAHPPGLQHVALRALRTAGFELEEAVASGGFGVVYRARDQRLGREVAVKVIDRTGAPTPGVTKRPREIETLAALRHPHIVPLFEAGQLDNGLRFFVMPWLEGDSLRRHLAQHGPLPVTHVVRLGLDLADALGALHERGLVHRDLKPENVLLDGEHAMVIDFGLVCTARAPNDADISGERLMGTPAYMSPEHWDPSGGIDGRADVYSLGCLLFELLTGHPAHARPSSSPLRVHSPDRFRWSDTLSPTDQLDASLPRALRRPPSARVHRPDVPAALDRLLASAMQPDRTRRPASALAFRDALRQVHASLLSGTEGRRTRRTVLLAAAAVVLLVPTSLATLLDSYESRRLAALNPQRVLVAPTRNATGDARLDPLVATVSVRVQETLSRRLATAASPADAPDVLLGDSIPAELPLLASTATVAAIRPIALERGTGTVVAMEIARVPNGLELRSVVIDARRGEARDEGLRALVSDNPGSVELERVVTAFAESIALTLLGEENSGAQ